MAHAMTNQTAATSLNATKALPSAAVLVKRLTVLLTTWDERRRTRLALQQMDPSLLRDVGLTDTLAAHEAKKPFWMA